MDQNILHNRLLVIIVYGRCLILYMLIKLLLLDMSKLYYNLWWAKSRISILMKMGKYTVYKYLISLPNFRSRSIYLKFHQK